MIINKTLASQIAIQGKNSPIHSLVTWWLNHHIIACILYKEKCNLSRLMFISEKFTVTFVVTALIIINPIINTKRNEISVLCQFNCKEIVCIAATATVAFVNRFDSKISVSSYVFPNKIPIKWNCLYLFIAVRERVPLFERKLWFHTLCAQIDSIASSKIKFNHSKRCNFFFRWIFHVAYIAQFFSFRCKKQQQQQE